MHKKRKSTANIEQRVRCDRTIVCIGFISPCDCKVVAKLGSITAV